jgi:ComF family protein
MISDGDLTLLERLEPVVVGVPLHPRRERFRGFNQADLLGKVLAKELGWVFKANVLKRVRYTAPQMQLSGEKRRRNLVEAFAKGLDVDVVVGRQVVLVDDVWTTGTTMQECTKVLRKAGANKVYGLTFARSK